MSIKTNKNPLQGNTIQSVDRALAILEAVGEAGEAGVTEIAEAVGLHVATTHNLLRTLTAKHYLSNASGRYQMGAAMAILASRWNPLMSLPSEVKPYLEKLSQETGEAASATVLVGTDARLVAFQPGTQPITIQFPQWVWPQAAQLATGRLLIAFEPEAAWKRFIDKNAAVEPEWSEKEWQEEFVRIREQGFYIRSHSHNEGQIALACPIRIANGRVIASIGVSAPAFRTTPNHCEAMLRYVYTTAVELSGILGWENTTPSVPSIDWATFNLPQEVTR